MCVQILSGTGKKEHNPMKMWLTGTKAESELGLKVAGIAVKVFIRDHNHHPLTPAHVVTHTELLSTVAENRNMFYRKVFLIFQS